MPSRRIDPSSVAPGSALAELLTARAAADEITVEHDGRFVSARAGEPLALSLLAGGASALARSIKFHRPRGPLCLRGGCDGCLVRLDGVPNVMACRVAARPGASVGSQNAFPDARHDLLAITDWFFPKQFDHHHLMVQFGPALNRAMQVFARRMAGMGTLPDRIEDLPAPERIECDALVVGAGPAGLAASAELARGGVRVLCVDEERDAGGTLLDEPGRLEGGALGPALAAALTREAQRAGVTLRTGASATATFDNGTLVVTDERALLVRARARVFANGGHEGVGVFESNDLPGVFTARAAARALSYGVLLGERVVLYGDDWPADSLADSLRAAGAEVTRVPATTVLSAARGTRAVSGVELHDPTAKRGARRTVKCDALIVALAATPAYELLGQAGVAVRPDASLRCFVPEASPDGRTERADVFAAGGVRAGVQALGAVDLARPLEARDGPIADGRRVARAALAYLASRPVAQEVSSS